MRLPLLVAEVRCLRESPGPASHQELQALSAELSMVLSVRWRRAVERAGLECRPEFAFRTARLQPEWDWYRRQLVLKAAHWCLAARAVRTAAVRCSALFLPQPQASLRRQAT